MATFEKTWQLDQNRPYKPLGALRTLTGQYMIWYLKAFLKGEIGGATSGLWTVEGSTDGTTAAMDGVDRWGATFDSTKIFFSVFANGTKHSWIVLKSPSINGVNYRMLLTCRDGTTGATNAGILVYFSKGAFTGGTGTTDPTATDQWGPVSTAGTQAMVWAPYNFVPTAADTFRVHAGLATDGSFFYYSTIDGTMNNPHNLFIFSPLADTDPSDLYPVFTYYGCVPEAAGWGYQKSMVSTYFTDPYSTYVMLMNNGRLPDGSAVVPMQVAMPCYLDASANVTARPLEIVIADPYDGSYMDWPMRVFSQSGLLKMYRGRVPDFYFGAWPGIPKFTVDPASGQITSVLFGGMWVPAAAAVLY
jgi:hypothetical protein